MQTRSILTILVTLALSATGLWSFPTGLAAAEAESDAPTTGTEQEAVEDVDSKEAPANPSTEVFIPTEEISEDFAVSFPVDI